MVSAPEQEANGYVGVGNDGNRGENDQQNNEINHDGRQDVQVNGSNVVIGEENDDYT